MKDSQRLRPVVRVAQQEERNAARQLGATMRQLETQQQQLNDLMTYRDEYDAYYREATKSGLSVAQVRDFQIFISRLDNAIAQQQRYLISCQQNYELSKSKWRGAHGHSKMIDKVVENRQEIERQEMRVREQREQDDRPLCTPYLNGHTNGST